MADHDVSEARVPARTARSLGEDNVRHHLTKFCIEHAVSYDLLQSVPIIAEALSRERPVSQDDEIRRHKEETERAKAQAEREAMRAEIHNAHEELSTSSRRIADLEDQVRALIHTIKIITNPPPHPPLDTREILRKFRA